MAGAGAPTRRPTPADRLLPDDQLRRVARRPRRRPAPGMLSDERSRSSGRRRRRLYDVHADVRGDAVQPRAHRRPALEAVQPLPRTNHRLLCRVVGVDGRTEHPLAVPRDLDAVDLEERGVVGCGSQHPCTVVMPDAGRLTAVAQRRMARVDDTTTAFKRLSAAGGSIERSASNHECRAAAAREPGLCRGRRRRAGARHVACLVGVAVEGATIPPEGKLLDAATFCFGVGVFTVTIALLLPLAGYSPAARRRWRRAFYVFAVYGLVLESVQAFRGIDPRFTEAGSGLDVVAGVVFGITAALNVVLFVVLGVRFFRSDVLADRPVLRLGIRYGVVAVAISFAVGVVMSVNSGRDIGRRRATSCCRTAWECTASRHSRSSRSCSRRPAGHRDRGCSMPSASGGSRPALLRWRKRCSGTRPLQRVVPDDRDRCRTRRVGGRRRIRLRCLATTR